MAKVSKNQGDASTNNPKAPAPDVYKSAVWTVFLTPGSDVSVSESRCAQYDHLSPGLYLLVEMHMDSCGHHG